MKDFVRLTAKTYSYLIDDSSEDKKAKDTKNCVIKIKSNLKIKKTEKLENNINNLSKNEIYIGSLKKDHK